MRDAWSALPEFVEPIEHNEQAVVVAGTGGAKSTMVATITLGVPSLVAIDAKGSLTLPNARVEELPPYDTDNPDEYRRTLDRILEWRTGKEGTNRIILRPDVMDLESFEAHDAIFQAIYLRGACVLWIDEITATGATANRTQRWLKAISARGRTRDIGLWTCTQRPFSLTPLILKMNAHYLIVGSVDPDEVKSINRPGIEIATTIRRNTGRFILYRAGERDPYRLYLPIPPVLQGWRAP